MAITERNKSLPGVEYILLTSSYAIEEFRTGAHVAEDRMQIMQQEIDKLIEKEYQLLNNTQIYNSFGLGTENIRIRLFNYPSISFFRLYLD